MEKSENAFNVNNMNDANKQVNINPEDIDDYAEDKKRYKHLIYKLMILLIDKYGVMVVDWLGYVLGLNENGKPISQQSVEELTQNIDNLNEKLKSPEVRDALVETIKESEPILQESLIVMLKVFASGGKYIIRDIITFICMETPMAPICGLIKFVGNTIDFGNDLLESSGKSVQIYEDAKDWVDGLHANLDQINEKAEQFKNVSDNYSQNLKNTGDNLSSQTKDTLNKYNAMAQQKIDKYSPFIPDSGKYKTQLNDFTNMAQNKTDQYNQMLKGKTDQYNQYAQNAANRVTTQTNQMKNTLNQSQTPFTQSQYKQMGGGLKKVQNKSKKIKKRTIKTIQKFKNIHKRKTIKR